MNWDLEIENLKHLVFVEQIPYEEIGRRYGCTGNNIKRVMRCRNIILPLKYKNKSEKYYCLNCGKDISASRGTHKYCSNRCQGLYSHKLWVEEYHKDNSIAKTDKYGGIPYHLRRYIFEKFDNKCCKCGWSVINPYTQSLPLEVDHINGNADDNSESNLQLLCPNCHSLTPTYKGANRGSGRKTRIPYL